MAALPDLFGYCGGFSVLVFRSVWQKKSGDEDILPLQSALLLAGAADNGVAGDGCATVDGDIYVSALVYRWLSSFSGSVCSWSSF